jgi:hypothetical protein
MKSSSSLHSGTKRRVPSAASISGCACTSCVPCRHCVIGHLARARALCVAGGGTSGGSDAVRVPVPPVRGRCWWGGVGGGQCACCPVKVGGGSCYSEKGKRDDGGSGRHWTPGPARSLALADE